MSGPLFFRIHVKFFLNFFIVKFQLLEFKVISMPQKVALPHIRVIPKYKLKNAQLCGEEKMILILNQQSRGNSVNILKMYINLSLQKKQTKCRPLHRTLKRIEAHCIILYVTELRKQNKTDSEAKTYNATFVQLPKHFGGEIDCCASKIFFSSINK